VKYTNKNNIPLAMCVMLLADDYDYNPAEKTVSATTLLDTTKQIILSHRLTGEGLDDVSNKIDTVLGSALHAALEKAWLNNPQKLMLMLGYSQDIVNRVVVNPTILNENNIPVYVEQRATKQLAGWTISGKFDIVSDGRVEDLKTRKAWAWIHQSNINKDILQLSIYKWLNPDKIVQDIGIIHWFIKNWDKVESFKKRDYPQSQILNQQLRLKSPQETEQILIHKLSELDKYWNSPEEDIPPCKENEEDLWMRPSEWKYYSKPEHTSCAKGGTYNNSSEAYMRLSREGNIGKVVEVKSKATKCNWCDAASICQQRKSLQARGLIQE
jgi:hypothetical protein